MILKSQTVSVRSGETDAIYCSETLCSCILLDKVLTGKMTSPIVCRERKACRWVAWQMHVISPYSADQNCFLTWHFSFNMSLLPLAISTQKCSLPVSFDNKKRLACEEWLQKRKGRMLLWVVMQYALGGSGCLSGTLVRCLAFKYLSQQLRVWKQLAETWKCEQEHTQGSDNPWPDGDGHGVSMGEKVEGAGCNFYATSVRNEYSSISPCATVGLSKFPGVKI